MSSLIPLQSSPVDSVDVFTDDSCKGTEVVLNKILLDLIGQELTICHDYDSQMTCGVQLKSQ